MIDLSLERSNKSKNESEELSIDDVTMISEIKCEEVIEKDVDHTFFASNKTNIEE